MIGTSEVHICKARTVGDWEEFNNFAWFGFWFFSESVDCGKCYSVSFYV